MKNITLEITDAEYDSLGIKTSPIGYDELVRKIKQKELRELFEKINKKAMTAGLDKMSDDEINAIIKEVRFEMRNGKNNS